MKRGEREMGSSWPARPIVHETHAWVWLRDLSAAAGRALTLADVPEAEIERIASRFDAVWLMGVWRRSPAGRAIAREHPDLQAAYRIALPDFVPDDVVGSPYAVFTYEVDPALGGDAALDRLRRRFDGHGLRLILDFVPNHLAVDHPWVTEWPQRFVAGDQERLAREPGNYFRAPGSGRILAHGRDPHFGGWTDTAQLDYRRAETRRAMSDLLAGLAERCDGVRCDMAMLVVREVFLRTWGGAFEPPEEEFWPGAISALKARHPHFLLLAEVYRRMEWALQQQGFDFTYDKRLYDRLLRADARGVADHLRADWAFQSRLARFIENHDERRAAEAFGPARGRAAATLALTLPGLRLLHDGQIEGRARRVPVQLGRRAPEPVDPSLVTFYEALLGALRHPVLREGRWALLDVRAPGPEPVVAHGWTRDDESRLAVVNLSDQSRRAAVRAPRAADGPYRVRQLLPGGCAPPDGTAELEVDLAPWGYGLLEISPS